jgi:simple sugar transport system permease protein
VATPTVIMDTTLELIAAAIRIATPLLFAALGGILSERAGVFAVGLEGMMLAGAFAGVVLTHASGSAAVGLLASAAGGAVIAAVVAVATARFLADQMVTGLAVNILSLGLTSFLLRGLFGRGEAPILRVPTLAPVPIPVLGDLPGLGPLLFRQPALTYVALALVVAVLVFLRRTRAGLTLRAVGENPAAAFAGGADPVRVRTLAVVAGGALAGVGGAVLSLQQVGTFTDGMTNGRGYLALAAIIVGRWAPGGALLGCLLFGAADALQLRIQGLRLPVSSYVVQMLPYVVSLAVLAGLGRGARLPAALGVPFPGR